jgi:hypothetical protein
MGRKKFGVRKGSAIQVSLFFWFSEFLNSKRPSRGLRNEGF